MKKIDKNLVLMVILGTVMVTIAANCISLISSGFASVINGGRGVENGLNITAGVLLNIPVVFFILRIIGKDCPKMRKIASLADLFVIFVLFIFGIAFASINELGEHLYVWDAASLFGIILKLVIAWFILDFDAFRSFIKSFKTAVVVEDTKAEEIEKTVEETTEVEEKVE